MFDPPRVSRRLALMLSALAISLVAVFTVAPQHAWAAEDDIASGDCGTCVWSIDANGKLTIAPEDGKSGQLPQIYGTDGVPWYSYRADIKKAVIFSGVKANTYCDSLFQGCSKLASVDVSGLDTASATSISDMFDGCQRLGSADLSMLDLSQVERADGMFSSCTSLSSVTLEGVDFSSLARAYDMFYGCRSLKSVDFSLFSGTNLKEMFRMFQNCTSLTSVDMPGLSLPKATSMEDMFSGCTGIQSVNLSGAKFPKLDAMDRMFSGCSSLTNADLSNLSIHCVDNLDRMFRGCENLESVSLDGLDCDAASNVGQMFEGCSSLVEVDFSKVKASSVQYAYGMFYGCVSLTKVDLSGIDSLITSSNSMFSGCERLRTIYDDGGLSISSDGDWTFDDCASLRGGNGTAYNDSKTGAQYARIDKPGQPGYFTCKHSEVNKVNEVAASSSKEGSIAHYECSVCEKSFEDAAAKKELKSEDLVLHAWGDWSSNGDATCTKDGTKTRTCSVCGKSEKAADEGSKLAHVPGEAKRENAKAATCTKDGSHDEATYCKTCKSELSRKTLTDPKLGHDYSGKVVAPTCTKDGRTVHECSRCGDAYEDSVVKATGHKPGEVKSEKVKKPTCTAKGSHDEVTYCTVCKSELSRETVDDAATGHAWGDWSPNGDATCTKDGTKTRTCSVCGKSEKAADEGSKLAHVPGEAKRENAKAATCTKDGSHDEATYCKTCKSELSRKTVTDPKLGHKPGDAKVEDEKKPTCTEPGSYHEVRYCQTCGEKTSDEVKTTDALGHDETTKTSTKPAGLGSDGYVETSQVCKRCGEVLATSRTPVASAKSVSLAKTGLTYSGKSNRPSVKVTDAAGNVLRSGVDYAVSYADNGKDVGTHKVTVRGKGGYSFTKTLSFVVNPKGTSLSKVTGAKKALTAKWGKQSSQTTGYQLRWSNKSSMKGAKTTTVKSPKTTSKKVTKLKKKAKYYVQVRTYKVVKGKTYYSAWSKAKSVKTR